MSGAILDDGIASAKVKGHAIIQLQPHLSGDDVLEVYCAARVHPGTVRLHVLRSARHLCHELVHHRLRITLSQSTCALWRQCERYEAETAQRWEVVGVRWLFASVRKLRKMVCAPEFVNRPAEQRYGIALDLGVADEDRLARCVMPRCYSSDFPVCPTRLTGNPGNSNRFNGLPGLEWQGFSARQNEHMML